MSFALTAKTQPGEQLVEAARALRSDLTSRAAAADLDNTVSQANFNDLIKAGIPAAFVPQNLGGMGLTSIYDWIVGIVELAKADASTAIAINMHLGITRGMAQAYSLAAARGKSTTALEVPLRNIVNGDMLICATATEAGTDNLHPLTEAVRKNDGWEINGTKNFVTMSPIATHLGMNLRMRDDDGDHLVTTMLPIDTPGLIPQNDWDALGMRGSGSQSVKFENASVPLHAIRKIGPWGVWSVGVLMNRALGNLPLVGAFLGIAEAAAEMSIGKLSGMSRVGKSRPKDSGIQHVVGEMEIELATCRAILNSAAHKLDMFATAHASTPPSMAAAHELMKDYQTAKWVVNRGAIDIVSKAMDLMGGAGYTNKHPLARLYRDVRAGPFMQPLAPTEARQYVGQVSLGHPPEN